jgi:5-hydroxyisourate hydrolase
MSLISAHVLDAVAGVPAAGMKVTLTGETGEEIAAAVTDSEGRIGDLGPERLPPGHYQVTFDTASYFTSRGRDTFFPRVMVSFTVSEGEPHYHVPLLLSPYSYTTYRGS